MASYAVAKPRVDANASYADFEKKLQTLLDLRPTPEESTRELDTVQALETADAAVALSDRMMQRVAAGQVPEAFGLGSPHAILTKAKVDEFIAKVTQQQPSWETRFGKSIGYELLRNDTVGDSLLRTVFLQRFDKHAIVWVFVWYRGSPGWILNHFSYAEDSTVLFR